MKKTKAHIKPILVFYDNKPVVITNLYLRRLYIGHKIVNDMLGAIKKTDSLSKREATIEFIKYHLPKLHKGCIIKIALLTKATEVMQETKRNDIADLDPYKDVIFKTLGYCVGENL